MKTIFSIIFAVMFFITTANAATFTPVDETFGEIMGELPPKDTPLKAINLQNKPLAFSGEGVVFHEPFAGEFVETVRQRFGETIQILDLSFNRLPEIALPSFLPLLRLAQFRFLDVTTNSGADSLEAMRHLDAAMTYAGIVDKAPIFEKIIWLREGWIDGAGASLPERYKAKHREYYAGKEVGVFQLPA